MSQVVEKGNLCSQLEPRETTVEELFESIQDDPVASERDFVELFYDRSYSPPEEGILDEKGYDFDDNEKVVYISPEHVSEGVGKSPMAILTFLRDREPVPYTPKWFGYSRVDTEKDDEELSADYHAACRGKKYGPLVPLAGLSLAGGPSESAVFYELLNTELIRKTMLGIGALVAVGGIIGWRYESGRCDALEPEMYKRRAEELVNRFGDYGIDERELSLDEF